jgi:iron(III) transport system substrate-binding protein
MSGRPVKHLNPPAGRRTCSLSGRRVRWVVAVTAVLVAVVVTATVELQAALFGRGGSDRVVVYTSQDQVYSEPILKEFERRSGIKTAVVYDSEAVKTVGLANRLLAERNHPQCDVFWSNEELRTRQLEAEGVFRKTNPWVALGYRSRRIIINTNLLSLAAAPRSLMELTNQAWRGKVALAYPLFGTTATHFLALRQHWGKERWEAWCRALASNKPFLVDGNSVAARLVGRGEAWVGLTDSDDLAAEQRGGAPLAGLPITEETLLIPNTAGVIRNAPHPEAAERLLEYLQQPAVARRLVNAHALEGVSPSEAATPGLKPDWGKLLTDLVPATEDLKTIFLR